jgi:3-phosphoshikimate 1-carboxyvinyltransferase
MKTIKSRKIFPANKKNISLNVPPSKSYTNRALICAGLAEGMSVLHNPSSSDDTEYLIQALIEFGIQIKKKETTLFVYGTGGKLHCPNKHIFVGNAGTTLRFLTTIASLVKGETVIDGDAQMQQRPIQDLLDALHSAGVHSESANGFPPIKIYGGNLFGGEFRMNATVSSQFLSSLLLCAPYARHPITIKIDGKISSRPYVNMTIDVMKKFGVSIELPNESVFKITNTQQYQPREYEIENDASSATYFFAAAAITQSEITVNNISEFSHQGDIAFLRVLRQMGCIIKKKKSGITVIGKPLQGITVDMNGMLDAVPSLAIIAAFAKGTTTITNIAQLKFKETDRLTAVATELQKIGVEVECTNNSLRITPKNRCAAVIETYNDHRIAMSFAIAGLCISGMVIKNPSCVAKSFPDFWEEFSKLESTH